jgi:hypothetical protein
MRQYLFTLAYLVVALVFYAADSITGAIALALIAFTLESVFWIRVLAQWRASHASAASPTS